MALAVLELTVEIRLALNSQRSPYFCLLSTGIKSVHPYTQLAEDLKITNVFFFYISRSQDI